MSNRESRAVAHIPPARRRNSKTRNPPEMSNLRIVLLGKSVSENSRVGNFILGRAAFDAESSLDDVVPYSDRIRGKHVTIINTPLLLNPDLSLRHIMQAVKECVSLSDPGPHVIILVLKPDECSREEKVCIEILLSCFSDSVFQHTLVLTTQEPEHTEPTEVNDVIKEIIKKCSNRHSRMERNSNPDDLIATVKEIVQENDGCYLNCNKCEDFTTEATERAVAHIPPARREDSKTRIPPESRNRKAMDSNISKTSQSLTTAEDMRNQTKLMMQPYANWEQYLTPAPLSIAIMGELVFISSSKDFSINKNSPKDGYHFIKYPDSFRACLMQVCNSGWWAFNEAHTSMDQIRLHTALVPDYMKTAVKILFQGDDEVVEAHLPDQLENIRVIADECLKLSEATEKLFSDVIKIIQELLEACVNAEHFYGEEKEKIKKKLEESKLREKSAQETKKRTERAVSAMEEELKQAPESYETAVKSLPGGWNMIGMDVVAGITQSVIGLTSVTHPVRNMCSATAKIAYTLNNIRDQEGVRDVVAEINAYSKSAEILQCVQIIQQLMDVDSEDDEINWTNLYDQKNKCTKSDFTEAQFKRISEDLKKIPSCPAKKQAENLCKKGMEICKQLAKLAPDGKCGKDKSTEIIKEVLELSLSAKAFDCKSKGFTNSPAIAPTPPMMYREGNSRAQLNYTRESYDKCAENLEKNEKELTEILITMQNCKLKEIDFITAIQMLIKGMDAMGRVKVQWEKMVHFFQMVSEIMKNSLNTTLKNFVTTSATTQALSYDAKLFTKDLLYTQASQACNIASLVNMISGTYTDVSNKYLMDRVSSLGRLMAMDKSKPEFEREQQLLQNGCREAQRGILNLVLKNKEEFERKSTARLEKIDQELLAILPPAPPEQVKRIQEVVKSAFSEEDEASYI